MKVEVETPLCTDSGFVGKLQGVHEWIGDGFEVGRNKVLHHTAQGNRSLEVL